MKKLCLSFTLLTMTQALLAQNNPVPFSTDTRIKHVSFQENNVVPVQGTTFITTQIQFADQERVLDIEGGDSAAWMVTYHPELSNMVFVKPTALNSSTNLSIITNQHVYYFHLISNKTIKPDIAQPTYALKFVYPTSIPAAKNHNNSQPAAPKVVNAGYRFSGSPELVPPHVFDDGHFTYFELSSNGVVPAIFAVDDKSGKEATVNTRRQGKYIVVHRLAPQFTLRLGGLTTSVFNAREISRVQENRRPQ